MLSLFFGVYTKFTENFIFYIFSGYYSRAYSVKPKDPLISLSMGLAYMHRSMQRISDNRHLQIMQVRKDNLSNIHLYFIFKYMNFFFLFI